jgi:hypothetical protein
VDIMNPRTLHWVDVSMVMKCYLDVPSMDVLSRYPFRP